MKTLFFLTAFVLIFHFRESKGGDIHSANWTIKNPFEQKVFIQDNGQFDGLNNLPGSDILYAVDNDGSRIYFTPQGLTYRFNKPDKQSAAADENQKDENKEEENQEVKTIPVFVQMQWEGANPQVIIEAGNKVNDYYTYLDERKKNGTIVANAFLQITYKNLYPNIDVVYTFHEKGGIKYAIILHPGADPAVIKMKYEEAEKIFSDKDGNIHLVTEMGDIIDHAPLTFYAAPSAETFVKAADSSPIRSSFIQHGNEIQFHLDNYDRNKTVVIDPWTINPSFPGANSGWDITRDGAGNIYCQGGNAPFYLKKFNPAGTLIWTYTYPNSTSWPGDFATEQSGFTYISYGAWLGTNLTKIDPSGIVIFNNLFSNTAYPNMEGWRMTQNCKTGALYGSGFGYDYSLYDFTNVWSIDTATGDFSSYIQLHPTAVEVRSMTFSPASGDVYVLSVQCSSTPVPEGNRIIRLDPSLSTIFNVTDGYPMLETQANYYPNFYGGYNGIAVGCYLYTYDGSSLKRWDKSSGIQIGTNVIVPGGTQMFNGGLFLDPCGNVYAGSSNKVVKYDATLNLQTTATTNGAVYDICSGNNPGEILVCGAGFISSIDMGACSQMNVTVTSVPAAPCTCTGSATATVVNGTSCDSTAVSFLWQPSGLTSATVTDLCPGSYTVTVTDTSTCFSGTIVDSVVIPGSLGGLSTTLQLTPSCTTPCNGVATAIPGNGIAPYTYLWSNSEITETITGLCEGTYTVTVTDSAGCTNTETFEANGSSPITLSANSINAKCLINNGSIGVNITGGTSPFDYLWSNGEIAPVATGLAPGDYNVVVTDSNGCSQSITASITMDSLPHISIAMQSPTACRPQLTQFISDSTDIVSYYWDFGDSTYSTEWHPLHMFRNAGIYTILLIVTTSDGCLDSIYAIDTITRVNIDVNMSNAFTPNGDGVNDLFKPNMNCVGNLNYILKIFSRWGELIFETNDAAAGWDGRYRGKPVPIGAYVYFVNYDCDNCSDFVQGNVTLIR